MVKELMDIKLYILLPSYNEGEALPLLLNSIYELVKDRRLEYEVVVINDGSEDDTETAARQWDNIINIKIINHEKNMGLGEAVNTGLSYFFNACSDDDAAVIMDADNTHDPMIIPLMMEKMESGNDVVIASRYRYGGKEIGLTAFRRLCSAGASLLLTIFFNIPCVRDYTCGYRLYTGRIIKRAYDIFGDNFIEEKGFTCMAEIIIKLYYLGCDITEIPLVLRYDLKKGKSKMKIVSTIRRYFVLIYNIKRHIHSLTSIPAFIDGKEK